MLYLCTGHESVRRSGDKFPRFPCLGHRGRQAVYHRDTTVPPSSGREAVTILIGDWVRVPTVAKYMCVSMPRGPMAYSYGDAQNRATLL